MRLSGRCRTANRGCLDRLDLREEAVASTGNSFHKAGTFGGIAQGLADFVDCLVEPVVEIHESVRGPQSFLKFIASYDLAGMLQQRC
jgi:hypothetical protein